MSTDDGHMSNENDFIFKWTLENLHYSLENRFSFSSPRFHVYNNNGRKVIMFLALYPKIAEDDNISRLEIIQNSRKKMNITWRLVSILCSFI